MQKLNSLNSIEVRTKAVNFALLYCIKKPHFLSVFIDKQLKARDEVLPDVPYLALF